MSTRAKDWWRQAEADLSQARDSLAGAHYEWACFAAQQAAEKAAKSVHGSRGDEAWGHSVTELLEALSPEVGGIDDALLDRARALDKHYVATRYPNGLPAGAPADYYTKREADQAIADAEAILDVCRRALSGA